MHEKRNFILILLLLVAAALAFVSWFVISSDAPLILGYRIIALVATLGIGAWLAYALTVEDKLPNHLGEKVG